MTDTRDSVAAYVALPITTKAAGRMVSAHWSWWLLPARRGGTVREIAGRPAPGA
jgi:predicted phosphoadenosine phosphosulfate sulfurtransferase